MRFEMTKLSFYQTVTLTCKDRLGLELHNMAVLAIMEDAIDTAHGHAYNIVKLYWTPRSVGKQKLRNT